MGLLPAFAKATNIVPILKHAGGGPNFFAVPWNKAKKSGTVPPPGKDMFPRPNTICPINALLGVLMLGGGNSPFFLAIGRYHN